MGDPFFFGFGSLVNRGTHNYPDGFRATLRGWRREWRYCLAFDQTFLSVVRDDSAQIDGLVARVPGADWAALDAREIGYQRHAVAPDTLTHAAPYPISAQVYAVPPEGSRPATGARPIWLSYLDVVVRGFHTEYGRDGVARFFATTTGWAACLDDRAAPLYPRAQEVGAGVRALVDDWLTGQGINVRR
jgi:hypothetical protein